MDKINLVSTLIYFGCLILSECCLNFVKIFAKDQQNIRLKRNFLFFMDTLIKQELIKN